MTGLARWMARIVWGAMLWYLRRPAVKRLRRNWVIVLPPRMREGAWQAIVRQDRFARRFGLAALTAAFTLLVGSMVLTVSFLIVIKLYESGIIGGLQTHAAPYQRH